MTFDHIFKNATVIDGTGAPRYRADVGVVAGLISEIGDLSKASANQVIDASGQVVAPGFIDTHAHDDAAIFDRSEIYPKLAQGVTTIINGNCGCSLAPMALRDGERPPTPLDQLSRDGVHFKTFAAYLDAVSSSQPAINGAFLVGHSTLRFRHMADLQRPADDSEIAAMQSDLHEALDAGALGMSTGVFYGPAQATTADELIAVGRPLSEKGGLIAMHVRNEADQIDLALDEAFAVSSMLQVPLVVSHHKLFGKANHGRSTQTLALIRQQQRLSPVCFDCYPYTASSSTLLPSRIKDSSRIQITWSKSYPEHAGRDLKDIAEQMGVDQEEAMRRLAPGGAVYFALSEEDVQRILASPNAMIGSDGVPFQEVPHPRMWGTFPRVLGHYARDRRLFPLEAAVHKMTGLPAQRFGLVRRGRVAPGFVADLTVFDAGQITDMATFDAPKQPPKGISHVMVNGRMAVVNGEVVDWHAGQVLRRSQ